MDLAQAAEMCNRTPGLMATAPPEGQADELLARAWPLAEGNIAAQARLLIAEAFNGEDTDPVTAEFTEQALALARRPGDPLAESARWTSSPRCCWPAVSCAPRWTAPCSGPRSWRRCG